MLSKQGQMRQVGHERERPNQQLQRQAPTATSQFNMNLDMVTQEVLKTDRESKFLNKDQDNPFHSAEVSRDTAQGMLDQRRGRAELGCAQAQSRPDVTLKLSKVPQSQQMARTPDLVAPHSRPDRLQGELAANQKALSKSKLDGAQSQLPSSQHHLGEASNLPILKPTIPKEGAALSSSGTKTLDHARSLALEGKLRTVSQGDFENDRDLNPLGLSQATIEQCLRHKAETTQRITKIDSKIKLTVREHERIQRLETKEAKTPLVGPHDPDCALPEDAFTVTSDRHQGDSTAPSRERALLEKKRQAQSDFTTSADHQSANQVREQRQGKRKESLNRELKTPEVPKSSLNPSPEKPDDHVLWSALRQEAITQRQSLNKSDQKKLENQLATSTYSPQPSQIEMVTHHFNIGCQNLESDKDLAVLDLIHSAPRPETNRGAPLSAKEKNQNSEHQMKRQSADARSSKEEALAETESRNTLQLLPLTQRVYSRKLNGQSSVSPGKDGRSGSQESPQKGAIEQGLLPAEQPLRKRGKKTLVLDLDETLVHSQFKPVGNSDFVLTIDISNIPNQIMSQKVYVSKRPYCDDFLEAVAPHFEIVMFTASLSRYAEPLFKRLDPKGKLIDFCLYREHCTQYKRDFYVKDLTRLGRPIEDVLIVDNSPNSYLFQPQNAFPCISWYDNMHDNELNLFIPIFMKIARLRGDVRKVLRKIVPRIAGNKVDTYRANKVLDSTLRKQVQEQAEIASQLDGQQPINEHANRGSQDYEESQADQQLKGTSQHPMSDRNSDDKEPQVASTPPPLPQKKSHTPNKANKKDSSDKKIAEKNLLRAKAHTKANHAAEAVLNKLGREGATQAAPNLSRNNHYQTNTVHHGMENGQSVGNFMCPNNTLQTAQSSPSIAEIKLRPQAFAGGHTGAPEYYRKVMSDIKLKEQFAQSSKQGRELNLQIAKKRATKYQSTSLKEEEDDNEARQTNSTRPHFQRQLKNLTPKVLLDMNFYSIDSKAAYDRERLTKGNPIQNRLANGTELFQTCENLPRVDSTHKLDAVTRTPDLKILRTKQSAKNGHEGNNVVSAFNTAVASLRQGHEAKVNSMSRDEQRGSVSGFIQEMSKRSEDRAESLSSIKLQKFQGRNNQPLQAIGHPRGTSKQAEVQKSVKILQGQRGTQQIPTIPKLNLQQTLFNPAGSKPITQSMRSMKLSVPNKTDVPLSILQSLQGTKSLAAGQPLNQKQILQPGPGSQTGTQNFEAVQNSKQALSLRQKKYSQQVDRMNLDSQAAESIRINKITKPHRAEDQASRRIVTSLDATGRTNEGDKHRVSSQDRGLLQQNLIKINGGSLHLSQVVSHRKQSVPQDVLTPLSAAQPGHSLQQMSGSLSQATPMGLQESRSPSQAAVASTQMRHRQRLENQLKQHQEAAAPPTHAMAPPRAPSSRREKLPKSKSRNSGAAQHTSHEQSYKASKQLYPVVSKGKRDTGVGANGDSKIHISNKIENAKKFITKVFEQNEQLNKDLVDSHGANHGNQGQQKLPNGMPRNDSTETVLLQRNYSANSQVHDHMRPKGIAPPMRPDSRQARKMPPLGASRQQLNQIYATQLHPPRLDAPSRNMQEVEQRKRSGKGGKRAVVLMNHQLTQRTSVATDHAPSRRAQQ